MLPAADAYGTLNNSTWPSRLCRAKVAHRRPREKVLIDRRSCTTSLADLTAPSTAAVIGRADHIEALQLCCLRISTLLLPLRSLEVGACKRGPRRRSLKFSGRAKAKCQRLPDASCRLPAPIRAEGAARRRVQRSSAGFQAWVPLPDRAHVTRPSAPDISEAMARRHVS